MKMKKVLAMTLAASMLVMPMTALASESSDPPSAPGAGDPVEVEIDGEVQYVDTLKYVVTLPTATDLDFHLDPQGVLGYFTANTSATTVEDGSNLDAYKGKIVATKYATVTNQSSVPVVVNCDFTLTSTAKSLNVITEKGDADADLSATVKGTDNGLCLQVVGGSITSSKFAAGTGDAAYSLPIGTTKTTAKIVLDKVAYEFKKESDGSFSYAMKTGETGKSAYFQIGGELNADSDWSEMDTLDKPMTLKCVYSFEGAKAVPATGIASGFATADATIELLDPVPASDGTTPIVITYEGADPTTIMVKTPKVDSLDMTNKFTVDKTAKTITMSAANVANTKGSTSNRGPGLYSFVLNGKTYKFKIN